MLFRFRSRLLIYFSFLLLCGCVQEPAQFFPHSRLIKSGDNPEWAAIDLDESDWTSSGNASGHGVFWVRFHIKPTKEFLQKVDAKGIQLISLGSYDAFWDGHYIGSNGVVGQSKAEEIPGTFLSQILLPDSLITPQAHVLALRVSKQRGLDAGWNHFSLDAYLGPRLSGLETTAYMMILGGIFLSAGFYYLLLFLRFRDRTRLIFGLMCLLFFCLLFLEYFKFLYQYPYPFHYVRLVLIGSISLVLAILSPWFFMIYFETPKRSIFFPIYVLALLVYVITHSIQFDTTAYTLGLSSWIMTLGVVVQAWWAQKDESAVILAVLLLFYAIPQLVSNLNVLSLLFDYDIVLFLCYALLVFTQLYLLAKRNKAQQLAYETTLVRSARLQNELLRKNIQPHFLMNTLTSLIDWVEESPKESVAFIEALAEEFSAFHAITEEKEIAVARSLHLCKSHLKVMSYRKEIDYVWTDENLNLTDQIPPGILLTLVENGVTHTKPAADGKVQFHLKQSQTPTGRRQYELSVFGQNRKQASGLQTGTGLQYIRSRLEESYGKHWTLESQVIENGWRTTFTLPH